MRKWLTIEEFSSQLSSLKSKEEFLFTEYCQININSAKIKAFAPLSPVTESEEFTDPGPCLKWFGTSSDLYFMIISYLGNNEFSTINLFVPKYQKVTWQLLIKLELPSNLINAITRVKGFEAAECSVFFEDERNLIVEMYRAENASDAESFQNYMFGNGFEKKLYIDAPDDLTINWIVEKNGEFVARYPSRYTSESFALERSGQDDFEYLVYSSNNFFRNTFKDGKKNRM